MLINKYLTNPITDLLNSYEKQYNFIFPEQYRAFITKYNGGETPNTHYRLGKISSDLKVLYGFGDVEYSFAQVKPIVSSEINYVPIGTDSFGNEIVIETSEGGIYFADHETGNIVKIASDFNEFIESCKSDGIKEASLKTVQEREQELINKGRGAIITEALKEMWRAEYNKYSAMKLEEVKID